ncbi:fumarylacetoacetate hydrolase family protein [Azospirillum sp.]|uniref:fumarylacetoacetate hydrolase family protein n=1 Tax=Azospirillum sp. TaxID=34012 RepID=UPI003D703024
MHLLRYGPAGAERPGLLYPGWSGRIRDLSGAIDDFGPMTLDDETLDRLRALDAEALPLVEGSPRIGPCVGGVGKIIGVGLNYAEHAAERGMPVPDEPILFLKSATAVCGPNDDLVLPPGEVQVDWGCELGIVIGRTGHYIDIDRALHHVAGYCVIDDVTERVRQSAAEGQWTRGKSADTFAPLGPWLVTRDAVPEPHALRVWAQVNGHRYQDGSTAQMVFDVPFLVHCISQVMTLVPGDVIATGTPAGVGLAQDPPVFLRPGDELRVGIEGLGEQVQRVVAWPR